MSEQVFETDVAVIGAGPVGLFAVFECGMLKLTCHVIDALDEIGGQCTALYPEKPIYDIPAYPEIGAADLIEKLEQQAAPFNPVYHLGQQVVSLSQESHKWRLKTCKNTEIMAKVIIIAGGAGAFGPNKPPLDNIEAYEGQSVFYMVRRKEDFRDKRIVIAGGGDSAVDWAVSLCDVAKTVTLVHRRDKFRAAPESVDKLRYLADSGKIELAVPYQLKALNGENGVLSGVVIESENGLKTLEIDILLPFYGLSMDLGPIAQWGLNLDHNHIAVTQHDSQTNIPGIFAIGDIVTYKNKLKLILTGFAEAAHAAHGAYRHIYPDQELHFEYSTTKGLPQSQEA